MSKSDDTRQKIADTALESFRERGYEQTTIRHIASEAGISVGNAYYYFPTKNHLVQQLYLQVQETHRSSARERMSSTTDLAERLEIALLTGLDALEPYHETAPGFLSAAIAPNSPVSPFGPDSLAPREIAISVFTEVVAGAKTPVPQVLREQLDELLWFAYLGLALYWVYDTSEGQKRSRRLVTRSVRLFSTVLPFTRLPFLRAPLAELIDIIREARS